MNKGELMEIIYTPEELKNIDPAIPYGSIEDLSESKWYVMNYNKSILGKLEDMRKMAFERQKVTFDMPTHIPISDVNRTIDLIKTVLNGPIIVLKEWIKVHKDMSPSSLSTIENTVKLLEKADKSFNNLKL